VLQNQALVWFSEWALPLSQDGWKIDGTDPFIIEYLEPHGAAGNVITYRQYADAYYGTLSMLCLPRWFLALVVRAHRRFLQLHTRKERSSLLDLVASGG
jgi:hypothetical protein